MGWLAGILLSIGLRIGLTLLKRRFPGIPDSIWELLEALLEQIKTSPNRQAAILHAEEKLKECLDGVCKVREDFATGVGQPSGTVGLG